MISNIFLTKQINWQSRIDFFFFAKYIFDRFNLESLIIKIQLTKTCVEDNVFDATT